MMNTVNRSKMSKKDRKAYDELSRNTWPINPATKVIDNKKHYSRKGNKKYINMLYD